ncbi:MAG: hypothetical protein ABIP97_13180 [Chthoniobacterales bacterium]
MKNRILLLFFFAMLCMQGIVVGAEPDFSRCKGLLDGYTCSPYLDEAVWLQSLPKEKAIAQLSKWADNEKYKEQVIILCRMLFEAKNGQVFKRPQLGGPVIYGVRGFLTAQELQYRWPLEPIALVDNIPFLIVSGGYAIAGRPPDPAEAMHYLKYCVEQTDWSKRHYKQANKKQMEAAFKKLMLKFKATPLFDFEISALRAQMQ